MKIVSWNVNSIKARSEHVKRYLKQTAPAVLMVQELKGLDFPANDFEALGYKCEAVTQKAYNGVAVFSKTPIEVIHKALPGDESDEQARYIEFETNGLRLINIYLPNGNPVSSTTSSRQKPESHSDSNKQDSGLSRDDNKRNKNPEYSDKFIYKLDWMKRLKARLAALRAEGTEFAIGGDFNVIPQDKDCWDPKAWADDALFKLETRQHYRALLNLGLTEAFRAFDSRAGHYTFWDYQTGRWPKDEGIRIDHFLLSPGLADRLVACHIDKEPRGWDKPSDHTPVSIEITAGEITAGEIAAG